MTDDVLFKKEKSTPTKEDLPPQKEVLWSQEVAFGIIVLTLISLGMVIGIAATIIVFQHEPQKCKYSPSILKNIHALQSYHTNLKGSLEMRPEMQSYTHNHLEDWELHP